MLTLLAMYFIFIGVLKYKIQTLIVTPVADLTERIKNPKDAPTDLLNCN
jgi:hypothetical protein